MMRYYITDRKAVGGLGSLLNVIRDQFQMGVEYIQIREKDLEARYLFEFAFAVLEARREWRETQGCTKVLINTRADIALAVGADGVHLPAFAPVQTPPGLLVARSCHTLVEVQKAKADLVTFGPVFDTPHKGSGQGLQALQEVCQTAIPVFALGGVTWENAEDCVKAGAVGIAGIRLFQQPEL